MTCCSKRNRPRNSSLSSRSRASHCSCARTPPLRSPGPSCRSTAAGPHTDGSKHMKIADVRKTAYAMPLTNPAFPPGPYRFFDREYVIITYRTDIEALRAVVPEPLEITEPLVKYEFIRMPDSTGFGDYTESGQVIPVRFDG